MGSKNGVPWKRVTVLGHGPLWTEPTDTEDSFPPMIASYEIVDGWVVYTGRNGSVGIVVGTRDELRAWKRQVALQLSLLDASAPVPWSADHGGRTHVREAIRTARRVLDAFGLDADVAVWVKEGQRAEGAAGDPIYLLNVHRGDVGVYIDGIELPIGSQIAAHEAAHLAWDAGGPQVMQAIQQHLRDGGEPMSTYHAFSNDAEGVMEAAALYVLAPRRFRKAAPGVFAAVAEWFGEA